MAEKKMVAGYIVVSGKRSLSRNFNWVRHRKGNLARAWVHTLESLLKNRDKWEGDAYVVFPAQYNPETEFAGVLGEVIDVDLFLGQCDKGEPFEPIDLQLDFQFGEAC